MSSTNTTSASHDNPPSSSAATPDDERTSAAALVIQRHYRGYRTRREMDGLLLSKPQHLQGPTPMGSDARWEDALLRLQQLRMSREARQNEKNDVGNRWKRTGFAAKQLAASGAAGSRDSGSLNF